MASEPAAPFSTGRWSQQIGRYLLLSAAVVVFATSLVFSFNKAAVQHEAALRDAGTNLRLAFLADHEMQQLRYGLDLFALAGRSHDQAADEVDRAKLRATLDRLLRTLHRLVEEADPGASDTPAVERVGRMIEELGRLAPELETFEPGDPAQHAALATRLDELAGPLHRMVSRAETIGLDDEQLTAQRRGLYLQEALYLLGMLGSGGVFIAMLLRETRRTRRLLAEATAAQVRIEHLAHHDPLTDLPNRWLFKDRLDLALRMARRHHRMVAMHCVDIDYFKTINDRYGHVTGDKVLVAVAERMQSCLRDSDTLARLGGDEFAIVQTGLTPGGALHLAERLLAAFRMPLQADGQELNATVSVGIGLYPTHGTTAEALHRAADAALYRAKAAGRDRVHLWHPDDDQADMPVRYRALAG